LFDYYTYHNNVNIDQSTKTINNAKRNKNIFGNIKKDNNNSTNIINAIENLVAAITMKGEEGKMQI
jgi:hypothetical protein